MEYRVLGPVEVLADERPVAIGGPKPRSLLVLLLLNAGRVVPTSQVIEALWGGRPPMSGLSVSVWSPCPDDLSGAPSLDASLEGGRDFVHGNGGAAGIEAAELLVAVQGQPWADGVDPYVAYSSLSLRRPNRADHTGSQPGSTDKTWLKTWLGSHRPFTSWSFL
jgi:hypothetical protein